MVTGLAVIHYSSGSCAVPLDLASLIPEKAWENGADDDDDDRRPPRLPYFDARLRMNLQMAYGAVSGGARIEQIEVYVEAVLNALIVASLEVRRGRLFSMINVRAP